jgi:phenylalanyl-tRNA synthetase alpha chain
MQLELKRIGEEIKSYSDRSPDGIERFRIQFVSKKSIINKIFEDFKNLSVEEKKKYGKPINEIKSLAKNKLIELSKSEGTQSNENNLNFDYSLPPQEDTIGSKHPLRIVRNKIIKIFRDIGFSIEDGPEIEKDWYNFTALNFPENHPAREMQDTFFISKDPDVVLRTHTSNVQIRLMESEDPPLRVVIPGRVYRNETVSAKSHCFFHQVEGLYVDKKVSFKDLKDTLYYFAREMFGDKTEVRFRPSYFPFTEPSAEMDIKWKSGWLEILGSGLVDPNVLKNCNIDPEEYSGFAFGMGIERIAMLKYGINDLRLFSENDKRFLEQFRGVH